MPQYFGQPQEPLSEPQIQNSGDSTPARVCILGASLDVENRGVRALGVSLVQLINRIRPQAEVVFHYGNSTGGSRLVASPEKDIEVQVRNCRMSPRSAPAEHVFIILSLALLHRLGLPGPARRNPWLQSLLAAELVGEIKGGDSFSDIYGLRLFLLGCLPILSVVLLGRSYVMLPQTYGPFRSRVSSKLAGFLLRRATTILTRDRNCKLTVRQLCGRSPSFCPDVAFTLEAVEPATLTIVPSGLTLGDDDFVVGVNVSGLLYMGGYTGRNMFGLRSEYPTSHGPARGPVARFDHSQDTACAPRVWFGARGRSVLFDPAIGRLPLPRPGVHVGPAP